MNKYKLYALCGMSGAGKDRILHEVISYDREGFSQRFHKIVNCTTRPPREGEVDGVHYHFLNNSEFAAKIFDGSLIEASVFKEDWFYGTELSELQEDRINIGVFNPSSIEILSADKRIDLTVFIIEASPKERLLRQLNRTTDPDVDEIIRRYPEDKKDFMELEIGIPLSNNNDEELWANVSRIVRQAAEDLGQN